MNKFLIAFVLGLALCQVAYTANYAAVKTASWGLAPSLVVADNTNPNDTAFRTDKIRVGGQNTSVYVVVPSVDANTVSMKQRQFKTSNNTFVNSTDTNATLADLTAVEGVTITTQSGYVVYATEAKAVNGKSNIYLYKKQLNATNFESKFLLTTNATVDYKYTVLSVFEVSAQIFVTYRGIGTLGDVVFARAVARNGTDLTPEGIIVNLTNYPNSSLLQMTCSDINAFFYVGCAFTLNSTNGVGVYYSSFTYLFNNITTIQNVSVGYAGYNVPSIAIAKGNNFHAVIYVNTTNNTYVLSSSGTYEVHAFNPNNNATTTLVKVTTDKAIEILSTEAYFNGYVVFYGYRSTSTPYTYKASYQAYTRDHKMNGTETELVDGITFFKTAVADNWALYGLFDNGTVNNGIAVGRIFNNTYGTALQMFLGLIAFMIGAIFFI